MCSMHGLPTIGTIGFGWFEVSGRRRVPSPPAMTTAFMPAPPAWPSSCTRRETTSASPTPAQKIHSGQSVPAAVTITKASDAYRSQVAAFPTRFTSKR